MSIGSIVGLVAGKIGELLKQEGELLYGVEGQVRSLQRELEMMNASIICLDEEGGDAQSLTTLAEIRQDAYDAEDAIESYILEAHKADGSGFLKKYACFVSSLPRTHQIATEIEEIKKRIVETRERWNSRIKPDDAGAGKCRGAEPSKGKQRGRNFAYPHTHEEHVVGLEEDINKLVGVLTSTTDGTDFRVLSVVGMGGSGKTTLARKLYNLDSVKKHFHFVAWLSISQEWEAQEILLQLLRKASGVENMGKEEAGSLQVMVEKLHRILETKKYLIFLDDVWAKEAIVQIFPALPNDGGKVLVTTRNPEVTSFPDLKCFHHEPRRLTEEESWELFRKIALIHREQSNNSVEINVLESLAKEMLKKCEGLPLAVIALAGILREKKTLEEWEMVKKAVSSKILEKGTGTLLYGPVKEMLALSYYDLPHKLKPCFLYLAMFPEDKEIHVGQLIRMWIAEGFITSDLLQEGETLEDVAQDYLYELIQRCVVQSASINYEGKVRSIRVHDLVRDLCIKYAKEQDFLEIFTSQSSNPNERLVGLRRTAIYSLDKLYLPLPKQSHHLRSLVYQASDLSADDQRLRMQIICQNFRLLRVLILESVTTRDSSLSTSIGSLIHLRYLGLRWTSISKLPSSIGNLRNLLTLDYRWSLNPFDLSSPIIPNAIWKIKGLRHLNLQDKKFKGRVQLHALKQLRKLSGIRAGSWMLEELPRLSPTLQKLSIMAITSKEQLEAAFQCPSIISDSLHSLDLSWSVNSRKGKVLMLENLQPIENCKKLRKLSLWGIIRDTLSSCNQFPTSIVKLNLGDTYFEEEVELAALGKLPNLVFLKLQFRAYVGAKWTWIAGQFPQLKELRLTYLHNWEEWSIEEGAMPQLRTLEIDCCEKVRRLPEGLKFISTLQELHIREKGDVLNKRIKGEGAEDAHIIQHVPRVTIFDISPLLE